MTTTYKKRDEDQELIDEVTALYRRGYRVTGWAVNLGVAAVICAVLALFMTWLAHSAAPITALQDFDIPAKVLNYFSNAVPSSGGGSSEGSGGLVSLPFESVTHSISGMLSIFQGPVMTSLALMGLCGCGAAMIFGGDMGGFASLLRLGLGLSLIIMTSNMLTVLTGTDSDTDSEASQLSPRLEFMQAVQDKRLKEVLQRLPSGSGLDLEYVRAQAVLMQDKKERSGQAELFSRVSNGLAEKPDFTPNEKVAYLIDEAAFNAAKNDIARKYRDESLARAEARSTWAKVAWFLFGLLSLVGVGLGYMARSFIKRCHRIDADLVANLEDERKKPEAPAA